MDIGSDAEILAAVDEFIAGREAGEVLHALYHRTIPVADDARDALAGLLPIEQISVVRLVDRLNVPGLPSLVILLATLGKIRTSEAWIHYNLARHLDSPPLAGMPEAKLPAIIHSLLALEGLKDSPSAQPLPLGVLARELATFAPREAIRCGMLAARLGDTTGLRLAATTFAALGLEAIAGRPTITQVLQLAKDLDLSADNIPQTTSLGNAAGLRSTMIEPPRRIILPPVRGDASHYIFAHAGQTVDLPGISVQTLEGGTFSIDATTRGLERHYVFDRNRDCVLEFANGTDPFIAETLLECDEPVAILDDWFSGAMNICHFLLDRLTRIPVYERAWSRPGKFFVIDDFPYYRDIFARLGLADRIITPSSKRISIRAPEILFSSNIAADFRHPAHYCADWAIDYLRRGLGIEEPPARPGRKLMISRADTTGRAVLNWEEVLPVFRRHGFDVVELAGLSTEAQMALFRDASQVVGVHGSGLTNILFATRDCAVLEILPPLVATQAYWLLASSLGQRYSALIAEDAELPRPDYTTWQHNAVYNGRDIVLPVERLETALASLDDAMMEMPDGETDAVSKLPAVPQSGSPKVPLLNVALRRLALARRGSRRHFGAVSRASIGEFLVSNPYARQPDYAFWKRAVSGRPAQAVDPVTNVPFHIRRGDSVATAGSCFAQHISKTLAQNGFKYLVTENTPQTDGAVDENYGVFPARFGNVYTVRQLLQLLQRAYGLFAPVDSEWHTARGYYVDPFRPRIQRGGFKSAGDLRADRDAHLCAVREMFDQSDVFVFTLGLTEGWESTVDGAVFPLAPGVVGADVPTENYAFHNFTVSEMEVDLLAFIDLLRSINSAVKIILTVSPVALIATFEDRHVLVSTTYSKAALRVVAEVAIKARPGVAYFPSYEIITGPQARGQFFDEDLREVTPAGVETVMAIFLKHYLGSAETESRIDYRDAAAGDRTARFDEGASMREVQRVICDENAIDP